MMGGVHYVGWTPRRSPPAALGADTESAPSSALAPLPWPLCPSPPSFGPLRPLGPSWSLFKLHPPCLGAPPIGYVGCPP